MKNATGFQARITKWMEIRWKAEDYPGGEPRFQIILFAKDIGIFVILPVMAIVLFKSCENAMSAPQRKPAISQISRDRAHLETPKSQIIEFSQAGGRGASNAVRRAPGSLVKVRLLNSVETYGTAPVHAQIIDGGLGSGLIGGTLIGDAVPDSGFQRINVNFRFVRDPKQSAVALRINARALSLDGTLGLEADKKEGFVARSVFAAASPGAQDAQAKVDTFDLREIFVRALASGFMQEFGGAAQVEQNRAQVLILKPSTQFFVELTEFFPGAAQ